LNKAYHQLINKLKRNFSKAGWLQFPLKYGATETWQYVCLQLENMKVIINCYVCVVLLLQEELTYAYPQSIILLQSRVYCSYVLHLFVQVVMFGECNSLKKIKNNALLKICVKGNAKFVLYR